MRMVNVFITSGYVCAYSPESPSLFVFREFSDQLDYLEKLSELLSDNPTIKGTSVNFIIDQRFVDYHYLSFPLINKRKIDKMLQFELEDSLIDDLDTYQLSYYSRRSKESGTTELGIYTIQKTKLSELQIFCKEYQLDLKWVLPFSNLLDLKFREEIEPLNHIYISIDSGITRILVYKKGFLTACSSLVQKETITNQNVKGISEQFLNRINQKILSIKLMDETTYHVALSENSFSDIQLVEDDQLSMASIESTLDRSQSSSLPVLVKPSILNQPNRISLTNTNLLIFQELRKQTKGLIFAAVILTICLLLYGSSVSYSIYQNTNQLEKLTFQYTETVKQFLPKGASKTNAVSILKNQVQKLKLDHNKNLKYAKREYRISKYLTDISLLKSVVPSLHLVRFSFNKQVIRFQGTVSSITEVEQLKEQLESLFPPESYAIKLNQRSIGNESVELSVSVHLQSK